MAAPGFGRTEDANLPFSGFGRVSVPIWPRALPRPDLAASTTKAAADGRNLPQMGWEGRIRRGAKMTAPDSLRAWVKSLYLPGLSRATCP
jgi:hypothetical protein